MPTCRHCGGEFATPELIRHEGETWLVVHCPECHGPIGRYRHHAGAKGA